MNRPRKPGTVDTRRGRREGLHRDEAGTVDREGFIAPSVGLVEHALYFTTAPDVLAKTRQIIDGNRLELPGAVIVWDETIGRRKGAKSVPGAWWAGDGSVTMSLVFPESMPDDASARLRNVASAVLDALASFSPGLSVSCDDTGAFSLDGKRLGMLHHEAYEQTDIFVLRVNGSTDFSKAPKAVRDGSARLLDYIDPATLPLGDPATLPNSLALEVMRTVPRKLAG